MSDTPGKLVVMITNGPETELASTGFTIAIGGITTGLNVSIFLTGDGVDIGRKGALETAHFSPLDPLKQLLEDFQKRGGEVWACTPCCKMRGYEEASMTDGVTISGASIMHEIIKAGGATLSF